MPPLPKRGGGHLTTTILKPGYCRAFPFLNMKLFEHRIWKNPVISTLALIVATYLVVLIALVALPTLIQIGIKGLAFAAGAAGIEEIKISLCWQPVSAAFKTWMEIDIFTRILVVAPLIIGLGIAIFTTLQQKPIAAFVALISIAALSALLTPSGWLKEGGCYAAFQAAIIVLGIIGLSCAIAWMLSNLEEPL